MPPKKALTESHQELKRLHRLLQQRLPLLSEQPRPPGSSRQSAGLRVV